MFGVCGGAAIPAISQSGGNITLEGLTLGIVAAVIGVSAGWFMARWTD